MRKGLEVKEWMASKIAYEKGRRYYDVDIYGTLKTTEKAVEVVFASETNGIWKSWCPKSQVIIVDLDSDEKDEKSFNSKAIEGNLNEVIESYHFDSFEDAIRTYKEHISLFI